MSEQAAEAADAEAVAAFNPSGGSAFADLMDTLVASEEGEAAGEAGSDAAAPAGGEPAGGAETAGGGRGGATPVAGDAATSGGAAGEAAPAADAGATTADGGAGTADGGAEQPATGAVGGDLPAGWTRPAKEFVVELGKLSTSLEERTSKAYQDEALEAVREEHKSYFDALSKHPRMLVGVEVPAIGQEGSERLRDTADAREWQDAVKQLLASEVQDRAGRKMEESGDFLNTVHQSIELFQNNLDLIPTTKDFDKELADKFTTLAKPYELRVEGKLQGYSIPVQPIIDSIRADLKASRKTAAPAAASTPAAGAAPPKKGDGPQAGVQSKAGSSAEVEDFSTLFGTLGLHNMKI